MPLISSASFSLLIANVMGEHRAVAPGNAKLGFLTIGQSPRVDVMRDIGGYLEGIEVVEAGALDGMTRSYIEANLAPKAGETPLVTRMRDGSEVMVSEERLLPLLQEKIKLLEGKGVEAIVILCSGSFPEFESNVPVIYPDELLKNFVMPLLRKGDSLGVIAPLREQRKYIEEKWAGAVDRVALEFVSPYTGREEEYVAACERLAGSGVKAIVLDCIGYSSEVKSLVRRLTKLPVISIRTALAAYLRELFSNSHR